MTRGPHFAGRLMPLALALLFLAGCWQQQAASDGRADVPSVEAQLQDKRRIIALDGGRNFRDLGGYRTADGQSVKWRLLFRSGSPAHLTEADGKVLDSLGITMACDLRSTRERQKEPNRWVTDSKVPYWAKDYTLDMAGPFAALTAKDASADKSRAAMIADYRKYPEIYADGFTAIFRNIAEGHLPLAFNCSAGKDRTGVASALILHALGVSRETILREYALSDKIVDYRASLQQDAETSDSAAMLVKLPWSVVEPLMASDPAYLVAAFNAMEADYGSIDAYIEKRLGVTPAMLAQIRSRLLEKA